MIVGLCGPGIDPATKQITLERLHAYLYNSLSEQQRPQLFGQEDTPVVLAGDTLAPISPQQSGPLSSAFSPGVPQASPVQHASTEVSCPGIALRDRDRADITDDSWKAHTYRSRATVRQAFKTGSPIGTDAEAR